MPNDPIREKFEEFCREQCSPGAHTSDWYYTIWRAAHRAGRASVIADMTVAAWLDPATQDVIIDARKADWQTHYGAGGIRKAVGYVVPLAPIPKE